MDAALIVRFLRASSRLILATLWLIGCAPGFCATAVFPLPNQVVADFADDPERYVALNILWDTSKAKNPSAVDQRSSYYNASVGIRQKYLIAGGAQANAFEEKIRQVSGDRSFRTRVLEKYQLANLPTPAPEAAAPIRRNTDVTDDMIKGALVKASPFMIASIVLMVLVAGPIVRSASKKSAVMPLRIRTSDLPGLPESLRVVKLPLLDYSVEMISAIALEKESTIRTSSTTTTTQGQVYSVGNQIHSTPGHTSTTVSSTQVDLIWIRTDDGRETSWTFSGGDFKVRPGHVLSAIFLPDAAKEKLDFLMIFNHNTSQFNLYRLIPFAVQSGRAWSASALIGSVGFGIAVAVILSIQPDPIASPVDFVIRPLVDWIMGGIASTILALFIVGRAMKKIGNERDTVFRRDYLNQYRQFLEQYTPTAMKHFGAVAK